jgi:UDP:flavonoid glycosyltransferase YjiC (YdhE family)
LPEAGAGIALCVSPHDENTLAEAMHRALTDTSFRAISTASAKQIAQQFSARSMAERTITTYERAREEFSPVRPVQVSTH